MTERSKKKFALWVQPETLEMIEEVYREDDCQSKSEFIERAIIFYYGFLTSQNGEKYLPHVVMSTLKNIVADSTMRINRMLFKQGVEIAIMQNLMALQQDIDPIAMERLRGECVQEVKRLNGSFRFEDALEWQQD